MNEDNLINGEEEEGEKNGSWSHQHHEIIQLSLTSNTSTVWCLNHHQSIPVSQPMIACQLTPISLILLYTLSAKTKQSPLATIFVYIFVYIFVPFHLDERMRCRKPNGSNKAKRLKQFHNRDWLYSCVSYIYYSYSIIILNYVGMDLNYSNPIRLD